GALPAVIDDGAALTVDCVPSAGPDVTTTVGCCVIGTPPATAVTTFEPAMVAVSVPIATPPASVGASGCVIVVPLPLADSVTGTPPSGWPPASSTVTVTVALPAPAVIAAGDTTTVDCDADTWLAIATLISAEVVRCPAASRASARRAYTPSGML